LVDDEEGNNEEVEQEIHYLGYIVVSPHLIQTAYEDSLICNHLNELSKGEKVNEAPKKYNLRSKQKEGKPSTYTQPKKSDTPPKAVASLNKEIGEQKINPLSRLMFKRQRKFKNPKPVLILRMKSRKSRFLSHS